MFACSDTNQKGMVGDIKNNALDGVVVASCSPKLHLTTFRNVTERADLNKYNYVHANIREQGSWAHSDDKAGATEKAIHIVKAAIAKARLAESLSPNKIVAQKSVAVIGGGIAGMKASLALSKMGCPVYLIEKEPYIGGRVVQWDELFTTDETGNHLVARLYAAILQTDNITVLTGAEVIASSGSIGNFNLKISIAPRYIQEGWNTRQIQQAIEICPVTVPDGFNFDVTNRKAIMAPTPNTFPPMPVIDQANCTRCGKCVSVCPAVDFSQETVIQEIQVGSVLMATGFDPYTPTDGEFGYHQFSQVITLPQFKRLMSTSGPDLVYQGKRIENVAYLYCVGSRQLDGDHTYCSRYCCTSAIHTAILAKKKFKNLHNYHFHRGIRTYGKQEALYKESLSAGDVFLQSPDDELPVVSGANGKTIVSVNDVLTLGRSIEVEVDLVVLVTGMVPRADKSIGSLFKLPRGRDSFFNEIHMKLRPVETFIDGVTIAGTSQGPKNIMESLNSALSAATKSYSYVSKGVLETEPIVAQVDPSTCHWCNACSEACPFDAISQIDHDKTPIALINNSICKGCGMCLPVCPSDSIDLIAYSNREIESMIDALAQD